MSATRFEILASAAQTATAQGGEKAVGNMTDLGVFVDVTAASGSLTVFLQGSSDGGTNWYDLPFDAALESAPSDHTAGSVTTDNRNILGEAAAAVKSFARYRAFGDLIRAAWVISGSGATFTFSVRGIGKN